jgi:molybdopterin synthase sulfur carrier subunit
MAQVFISAPMRKLTNGQTQVHVSGSTLRELIENLEKQFPGIRLHLMEDDQLMPGLAAIVDGEATIYGLYQKLSEHTEVHFLPAISGGGH